MLSDLASSDAQLVLPCDEMATEDALRTRVRAMTQLGLQQKAVASAIGRSQGWVSRWLDEDEGYRLRVDEMDRLNAFFRRIAETAMRDEGPPNQNRKAV